MKIRALLTERSLNIKAFYSKEVPGLEGCELGNIVYDVRSSKTRAHLSSENLPCFVSSMRRFGVQKLYAISIGDSYHVLTSFQGMLMLHVLNCSVTTELCQQGDFLSSHRPGIVCLQCSEDGPSNMNDASPFQIRQHVCATGWQNADRRLHLGLSAD